MAYVYMSDLRAEQARHAAAVAAAAKAAGLKKQQGIMASIMSMFGRVRAMKR